MRKITLLLCALLLGCIGMEAQPSQKIVSYEQINTVDDLTPDGYYILFNTGHGTFLHEQSNGDLYLNQPHDINGFVNSFTERNYVIKLVQSNGKWKFQMKSGKFIPALLRGKAMSSSENGEEFTIGNFTDGHFYINGSSNSLQFNGNGTSTKGDPGSFTGWDIEQSGGGNSDYQFYQVTLEDVTMGTVTFNYQINGKLYTSIDVDCEIGSPLPEVPACDFVTILGNDFTGEFVTEASTIVNVTCEPDLPFTASASVDFTNATWYAIDIHSNDGNYYWKYVSDNENNVQTPPVLSTSSKDIIEDNYLWCFVGNLFDGFKIYNKAAGDNMTLKWGTKAFVLSDNNDNNAFKILTASNGIAGATCFTLNGTNFINHQTDTGLHLLKTWTDRDKGSSCRFFAPSTFMLNCAEGYLAQAEAPAGAVGTNPNISDIFDDLQSATDDVKDAPHGTEEMKTLSALLNQINDNEAVGFENGGYYRIICADPNFKNNNKTVGFLYASSTPNYIRWGIINNNNINTIFQISSSTDNGYNIKNCNKGQYMQGVGGMLGSNTPNVDFIDLGGAQYNIHFSNGYCHASGHNDGQGDSGGLSDQIGNRNSPSAWYIIPATDIEIALNEGEGNYWASTYLPFGVSAQEDSDLQIYTGKVSGDRLLLEATETLPAETGAILKGTSGTCTLNIVAEANANAEQVSNDLQGTLTELPGINSGDYLVLGKADGKVGLYTTNTTTLKANKAYLPASLVQGVNGLRFSFGEITGIDSAATEQGESKAALYDLSGRRVALPTHGIYVKDGKKILVR